MVRGGGGGGEGGGQGWIENLQLKRPHVTTKNPSINIVQLPVLLEQETKGKTA